MLSTQKQDHRELVIWFSAKVLAQLAQGPAFAPRTAEEGGGKAPQGCGNRIQIPRFPLLHWKPFTIHSLSTSISVTSDT